MFLFTNLKTHRNSYDNSAASAVPAARALIFSPLLSSKVAKSWKGKQKGFSCQELHYWLFAGSGDLHRRLEGHVDAGGVGRHRRRLHRRHRRLHLQQPRRRHQVATSK